MARKSSDHESGSNAFQPPYAPAPRELIVVAHQEANLRSHNTTVSSLSGTEVSDLDTMLKKSGARMTPLFGDSEDRLQQERASMAAAMPSADAQMFGDVPDLSLYYRVDAADDSLDELAAQLVKCKSVNAAYVKPPAYPSQQQAITDANAAGPGGEWVNIMQTLAADAPPVTANFTARQGYLNPAPGGIDALYNTRPAGFPASWRNPFNRNLADSGSILIGAGAPPPGTHGRNHGADRSRLDFSNFGSSIDAQGWGREVTTCGYGDLQGGANEDLWYTDQFSGTSSASPIVVGAVACVQGALRARQRPLLSPTRARALLRATGSPQTDAPGRPRSQRIGNRPNLRQLIASALQQREWLGVQFTGSLPANATRRWFTHSWPEHLHVLWNVVPLSPRPGAPQIAFNVRVERASDRFITYWIDISNLTNAEVQIEARYAVLGW